MVMSHTKEQDASALAWIKKHVMKQSSLKTTLREFKASVEGKTSATPTYKVEAKFPKGQVVVRGGTVEFTGLSKSEAEELARALRNYSSSSTADLSKREAAAMMTFAERKKKLYDSLRYNFSVLEGKPEEWKSVAFQAVHSLKQLKAHAEFDMDMAKDAMKLGEQAAKLSKNLDKAKDDADVFNGITDAIRELKLGPAPSKTKDDLFKFAIKSRM